jgi:hypothetical protein
MPDKLTLDERGALIVVQVDDEGNRIDAPVEAKPEPFGGKGDHDNNGKVGGAAPPVHRKHRRNKRG